MFKIFPATCLLLALMGTPRCLSAGDSPNLLSNGDFTQWVASEGGEQPSRWGVYAKDDVRKAITIRHGQRDGKEALVVDSPRGGYNIYTSSVAETPGRHTFSVKISSRKKARVTLDIRLPQEGEENWLALDHVTSDHELSPDEETTLTAAFETVHPGQKVVVYLKVRLNTEIVLTEASMTHD
ncbi:MAG TPA: hypothetical protein VNQ90_14890 [Chthoniobacteraceae bacterium]|nr:hypothetical protein [Chthoniobacteraceae bacterium]